MLVQTIYSVWTNRMPNTFNTAHMYMHAADKTSSLKFILWLLLWKTRGTHRSQDQSDIKVAQLLGIYGNVNQPCPWAVPSDLVGLFHKSLTYIETCIQAL